MSLFGLFRDWVIDPIGMIFLLSLLLWLWLACTRFSGRLVVGGLVWLVAVMVVSAPRIVNPMLLHYENQFAENPSCLANRPIVLLGGGVDSRVQQATQIHFMAPATFTRANAAAELAAEFADSPLLVAGGALRTVTEAQVMGHFLKKLGVPESRIYEEGDSSNTFENARNIRALIDQHEFDEHINLVTSALHMKRAKAVFEKQGLTVCPVAVDRRGIEGVPNYALWPQITAMNRFDLLLHEQVALLLYKIRGQI